MKKLGTVFTIIVPVLFSGCLSKVAEVVEEGAPKEVPTYFIGKMMSAKEITQRLTSTGFEVLGTFNVDKKNSLKTVVFTNPSLIKMANKPNRGFSALGRILIDEKNNQIVISNPLYFGKAFLQADADYFEIKRVKEALVKNFSELKESDDKWNYHELSNFHFMVAMPYYQDSIVLAKGPTETLLKRVKSYKGGKFHLFTLKLAKEKYLVGYRLGKKASSFIENLGVEKAGLLPYTILIENNSAKIMAPKYYLALSYPALTMGQFMRIATIPSAIIKDMSAPFKN